MPLSKLPKLPQLPKWLLPHVYTLLKQKECVKPVILDPDDPLLELLQKCSSSKELLQFAVKLMDLNVVRIPSQLLDRLIAASKDEIESSKLLPQILTHFKYLKSFFNIPNNNVFRSVLPLLTQDQVNILIRRHPLSHDRIEILLEFICETGCIEFGYDLCFEYLRINREFLLSSEALRSIGYLLQVINFRERIDFTMAELVKITGCIRINSIELKRNRRDYERLYGIYRFLRFQNFPLYDDQHERSFLSWIIQYSDNARFFRLDASELRELFILNSFAFTNVIGRLFNDYSLLDVADVFVRWLPFKEGEPYVQKGIDWLVEHGRLFAEEDIKMELSKINPRDDPFMTLFASICLIPHLETSQHPPTTVFEVTALIWSAIIANNFQSGEDLGLTVTGLPSSGDLTNYTGLIRQTIWMFQCVWPGILICAGIIHITNTDGERFEVPPVVGRMEVPKPVIDRFFARLQMEMDQDAVNTEDAVHIIFWLLTLLPYDGKKQDVSNMISSIIASLIVCFKHTPNYDPEHDPTHEPEQCLIKLSILDSLDILFKYRKVNRMTFEQIFCSQLHDDPQIWGMLLNDPLQRFEHLVFYLHRMDMSAEKEDDASIIECSICTSQFSTANPGTVGAHLPIWAAFTGCGHSLCCSCSSKFPPTGANLSLVRCPFCRKESIVVLLKNTEFRICCDAGDADNAGDAPDNAGNAGDAGDAPDDSGKQLPPAKKPRSDE